MKTFDREGQIWNCLCGNGCFGTVLELSSFCGWIITVITHRPPSRSLIATHQTSERPCHGQIWRSREACAKSKSKSHLLLHPSHRWASPYWGSALSSSQNRVHCQLYCMWAAILDGIALVLASIAIVIASSTISMAAQQCPPDAFSFQNKLTSMCIMWVATVTITCLEIQSYYKWIPNQANWLFYTIEYS